MLVHRLQRWTSIRTTAGRCHMLMGDAIMGSIDLQEKQATCFEQELYFSLITFMLLC